MFISRYHSALLDDKYNERKIKIQNHLSMIHSRFLLQNIIAVIAHKINGLSKSSHGQLRLWWGRRQIWGPRCDSTHLRPPGLQQWSSSSHPGPITMLWSPHTRDSGAHYWCCELQQRSWWGLCVMLAPVHWSWGLYQHCSETNQGWTPWDYWGY